MNSMRQWTIYPDDDARKRRYLVYEGLESALASAYDWQSIKEVALRYLVDVEGWRCRKNASWLDIVIMLLKECLRLNKGEVGADAEWSDMLQIIERRDDDDEQQ